MSGTTGFKTGLQYYGFLNINKPKGMTSHDVVANVRRLTGIRQIGHTGTLDPFAEGVLPICIGKATRLIEYLDDDKAYIATIQFGSNTDTYDIDGQVTETFDKKVTQKDIEASLENFCGEIEQLPPIYSAIKVNGKKLYEYARNGEQVEITPRKITIYELELISFNETEQSAQIKIKCSKGTYIRSLAFDIGKALKTGAHLSALIRTQAGKFNIENSITLQKLVFDEPKKYLINPLNVLSLKQIEVAQSDLEKIKNGVSIKKSESPNNEFILLTYQNNICAVGFSVDNIISLKKVFL